MLPHGLEESDAFGFLGPQIEHHQVDLVEQRGSRREALRNPRSDGSPGIRRPRAGSTTRRAPTESASITSIPASLIGGWYRSLSLIPTGADARCIDRKRLNLYREQRPVLGWLRYRPARGDDERSGDRSGRGRPAGDGAVHGGRLQGGCGDAAGALSPCGRDERLPGRHARRRHSRALPGRRRRPPVDGSDAARPTRPRSSTSMPRPARRACAWRRRASSASPASSTTSICSRSATIGRSSPRPSNPSDPRTNRDRRDR